MTTADGKPGPRRLHLALALSVYLGADPALAGEPEDLDSPIVTGANNVGWRQEPAPTLSAAPLSANVLSASALSEPAAAAQPVAALEPVQDSGAARQVRVLTPIQGPVRLDGRYLGDISGEVGLDGSGLVDAARLIGLLEPVVSPSVLEDLRDRIGGRQKVDFETLRSEAFSLSFDTLSLSFEVQLGADSRALRQLDFGRSDVVNPAAYDPQAEFSAAANVSIGQAYDHRGEGFKGLRGVSDVFVNWGGFDGVTLTTGFDYDADADDSFRRREIRLTKDLFGSAIRLTAGEFSPPVTGFQGSDRILGFSAGRAYSVIRPFQNIRPSGRREFVLDRQSFVEVEVNGVVVERLQLDPGPYSLSDFPFAQGANAVRLLVDDGVGRREIAVFDLYGGAGLLDPGVIDFGFAAGVLEEGGEFRYGGAGAVSGYVRKGLTDSLSAGLSGQWVDDRVMAGGTVTWGSPLGLVELGLAGSRNEATDQSGYAASFDYVHELSFRERDDTRVIVTGQAFSRHFQHAFERVAVNPEAWRVAAQVSSRLRRYTMNLGAAFVKGRDGQPDERSIDASIGRSFGRFGVTLSVGHRSIEFRDDETRIGLSLTVGLGQRWNAQARYDSGSDFQEVLIRRSPTGELNEVSGGLRASRDSDRESLGGDLRYINNRFDAELVSNRLAARTPGGVTTQESLWRVSSLLAYADGAVGIGRPAREGFVMARRHSSLRGSSLALTDGNGRQIARAGLFGPAVAPVDRAYSLQRFEVAVEPLPSGYDLGAGVISVFPGYGAGYAITIGSDASRTAVGLLINADGSPAALLSGVIVPAGEARAGVESRPFFTNRAGRFVGDGLAPGRYRLVVGERAVGEFVVPEDSEGLFDVGRIQIQQP